MKLLCENDISFKQFLLAGNQKNLDLCASREAKPRIAQFILSIITGTESVAKASCHRYKSLKLIYRCYVLFFVGSRRGVSNGKQALW